MGKDVGVKYLLFVLVYHFQHRFVEQIAMLLLEWYDEFVVLFLYRLFVQRAKRLDEFVEVLGSFHKTGFPQRYQNIS